MQHFWTQLQGQNAAYSDHPDRAFAGIIGGIENDLNIGRQCEVLGQSKLV
jgi:hypothetical protein